MNALLEQQIQTIPAGAWAIGVSGGADSVALLCLARQRADLRLHVVHLNHETRGNESDGDGDLVAELATRFNLPATIARRSDLESCCSNLPTNPSARFRRLRQELFAFVVGEHHLSGVLLAHHASDQAETVLQRLLRGSGWLGLCGMTQESLIRGICYFRPLLGVQSNSLRLYLRSRNQTWREDASNDSGSYQRNRVRQLLRKNEEIFPVLIELAESARAMRLWTKRNAPVLSSAFPTESVAELPRILRQWAIADWLQRQGVPRSALSPAVIERVAEIATDAATPSKVTLPGRIMLHRSRGIIRVM